MYRADGTGEGFLAGVNLLVEVVLSLEKVIVIVMVMVPVMVMVIVIEINSNSNNIYSNSNMAYWVVHT